VLYRLLFSTLLFVSVAFCADEKKEKSLEERVRDLEGSNTTSEPTPEQKKVMEQNLAEIRSLGLVDRALKEFSMRFPKATIKEWKAGYFGTKEVVAFSVFYTLPQNTVIAQQEFGFRKENNEWKLWWIDQDPNEKKG